MRMLDIIDKKRNGGELTATEIAFFIDGVVNKTIPDYQISALLMAIYFQDMTAAERKTLTMKMMESGDRVDLSAVPGIKVDKHSTGGVGDKVSLPLTAMVAALGIPVPMISGRGLGHTGGTLDKLEAIPGMQVEISEKDFVKQVTEKGLAIIGATGDIAPADKIIYALRDVTDTVDSLPLIASSIMSKKIASGTDALVIDVKTGAGAFMKTKKQAVALAQALVEIGQSVGMQCVALITDMNQPLGYKIGNALEIEESLDLLKGQGPADLKELTLALGSYMVVLGQKASNITTAKKMLEETITSGSALERFRAMIEAQGGDGRVVDDYGLLPQSQYQIDFTAPNSGVITQMAADELGIASMLLGGGRQQASDQLDYAVGLELHKKVGDAVEKGDTIVTIHGNQATVPEVEQLLLDNIQIGTTASVSPMVYQVVK